MEKTKQGAAGGPGGAVKAAAAEEAGLSRFSMRLVFAVAIMVAVYLVTAFYVQDKVATGTTVLGVDVGGLKQSAALEKLEAELPAVLAVPIDVSAGTRSTTLDPAQAGLAVDFAATIDNVTGFTLNPFRLWPHVFGAGAVDPVVNADADALVSALKGIAPNLDVEPVDGAIDLSTGAPVISAPVNGVGLDSEASADLVLAAWPEGARPVELVMVEVEPAITEDDLDDAMRNLVGPLLSGPVTLSVEDSRHVISVAELAAAASIVATDAGVLDLQINGEAITARIYTEAPELGNPGVNASFTFQEGRPVVVPSESGLGLEVLPVGQAVRAAALSTTRSSAVPLSAMEPSFTTEDANALGIAEIVAEFSTPLTNDAVRTTNLITGAAKVSGTLLKPGETYSLLGTLQPINAAAGFVESFVVEKGVTAKAMGGGLSQMSTTLYNAAYFAGMDIIQFRPHSRWFDRYPEGRESTLWEPTIDLRFINNTPYGVLFQSWVSDGRVYVRAWSTKYFEVESYTSPRRNFTNPGIIYNEDPECIAEGGGQRGFTVDVTRIRYLDGAEFDRTTNTWTYAPWHQVICGPPPDPNAAPLAQTTPPPAP